MCGIHVNHSIFPFYILLPEKSWGNSTLVTHPDISSHPPSCIDFVTLCGAGGLVDQPHCPFCVLTAPGLSAHSVPLAAVPPRSLLWCTESQDLAAESVG